MRSGEWKVNGETIKISPQGKLTDGQARLSAITQLKKPVVLTIAYGVPEKTTIETVDSGKVKTVGDFFRMIGVKNAHAAAAVVKDLWHWERKAYNFRENPTKHTAHAVIKRHPTIHESISFVSGYYHGVETLPPLYITNLQFVHYLITHSPKGSKTKADQFILELMGIERTTRSNSITILRRRLIKLLNTRKKMSRSEIIALMIKAWNSWVDEKDLHSRTGLMYTGTENFPMPR
jgi:hypothetical protein